MASTEALPACRLCGVAARRLVEQREDTDEPVLHPSVSHPLATTYRTMCPLELIIMDEADWRKLMGPPTVMEEMKEGRS